MVEDAPHIYNKMTQLEEKSEVELWEAMDDAKQKVIHSIPSE